MKFLITIFQDEDGMLIAECPSIPGCVSQGATEEEVQNTRDYLGGIIALELQTTEQIATRAGDLFVYDLPDDYLAQQRKALMSVSRAEVNRAASKHIHVDQFAITIVGDAKLIESELTSLNLGPVAVHES